MSGYNQNCIISPMPQVSAATAAHSGPYTIKSSDSYQGALVVISGLAAETVAVQISPDGVVDLRGAVAYKFVKSGAADTAIISHSNFRYS